MIVLSCAIASVKPTPEFEVSPKSVITPADDYHSHYTLNIGYNAYKSVSWSLYSGNGIYGNFQVTSPASGGDQIIDFFICDQANFDHWLNGESASVYELQQNVAEYSWKFIIPSTDTWYFVWKNHGLLVAKTVDVNLYRDDTPPAITMNLDAGATYSNIKEITATITEATFDISSVKLYIDGTLKHSESDSSFSYSWVTGDYSNGAHTIRISASDNVGNSGYEEVTVYVSNIVPTSSSSTGTTYNTYNNGGNDGQSSPPLTSGFPLLMLGGIGLVMVVGVGLMVSRKPGKAGVGGSTGKSPDAKVLIVCPYCGGKTEQGLTKCQKCGADL